MRLIEKAQAAERITACLREANGDRVRTEACLNALEAICIRIRREAEDMVACVEAVDRAIRIEGPYPGYHRAMKLKHMMEWPALWAPIGELQDWLRKVTNG